MKFLLLLIPVLVFATPEWFFKIKPKHKNELIGYGVAKTLSEAKKRAISDVTQKLYVSVKSSTELSVSDHNGDISKSSSTFLSTSSNATLSGIEFIEYDYSDGKWYVASSYDNSSIEVQLKKLLKKDIVNEKQNSYLEKTSLIKKINSFIGYTLDYSVIRKDGLWQLNYSDIYLPLNQDDFYDLFVNSNSNKIKITANKKRYNVNDMIYFKISKNKKGYVSVLYVEHNGKVGVLLANKKTNKSFTFPDLNSKDIFNVVNPYKKTVQELYIAIYSNKKINLNKFEDVSQNTLDESNYNFDKLIFKLKSYDFSSYIIKIKPNK